MLGAAPDRGVYRSTHLRKEGMRQRPAYCVHKSKNLAYVRIRGRMIYLGRAHSRESLARYSEIVAAVLAGEEPPRGRITPIAAALNVGELAERWTLAMREQRLLRHAELAADLRDRLARPPRAGR